MKKALMVCALTAISVAAAQGCVIKTETDRFKEAIPNGDEVKTGVPGSGGSGGTSTKSLRIQGGTDGTVSNARYYEFTREVTWGTDVVTGVILSAVKSVTDQPATTLESKKAVWGPAAGSALEPVVWRFTVEEGDPDDFNYKLEGRPKAGGDGDYKAVLVGKGYGAKHTLYKTGWFTVDNDAFKSLDRQNGKDAGSVKVTYDLKNLETRTISVEIIPGADKGDIKFKVQHQAAGAGYVDLTGHVDIEKSATTKLEDVAIYSRWNSSGAGRADISIQGGDAPGVVKGSECWSSAFSRVYYSDSLNSEPSTGDAKACAFTDSKL
jgi:hypothetical protein